MATARPAPLFSSRCTISTRCTGAHGQNYRYARPGLEVVDWGKELNLTDPFGNRLRFCEQSHEA